MTMEQLSNILGNNSERLEELIAETFNNNLAEIEKIDKEKDALEIELRDLFVSFGLDNCINNMDEIEDLRVQLDNFEENQADIIKLQDKKKSLLNELKEVYEVDRKSPIGIGWADRQEKIKNLQFEISQIDVEINKINGKINSKNDIKQQIEELYNNISQSMIVLDEEQMEKIRNVYSKNSIITEKLFELTDVNNSIINQFPNIKNIKTSEKKEEKDLNDIYKKYEEWQNLSQQEKENYFNQKLNEAIENNESESIEYWQMIIDKEKNKKDSEITSEPEEELDENIETIIKLNGDLIAKDEEIKKLNEKIEALERKLGSLDKEKNKDIEVKFESKVTKTKDENKDKGEENLSTEEEIDVDLSEVYPMYQNNLNSTVDYAKLIQMQNPEPVEISDEELEELAVSAKSEYDLEIEEEIIQDTENDIELETEETTEILPEINYSENLKNVKNKVVETGKKVLNSFGKIKNISKLNLKEKLANKIAQGKLKIKAGIIEMLSDDLENYIEEEQKNSKGR